MGAFACHLPALTLACLGLQSAQLSKWLPRKSSRSEVGGNRRSGLSSPVSAAAAAAAAAVVVGGGTPEAFAAVRRLHSPAAAPSPPPQTGFVLKSSTGKGSARLCLPNCLLLLPPPY